MSRWLQQFSRSLCTGLLMAGMGAGSALASSGDAPEVVVESPEFADLVDKGADIRQLYAGAKWSEGPLALPDGSVIWSDIKNNRVMIWREGEEVREWLRPAQFHNGHTLDHDGRVLAASHGKRAVERQNEDGKWEVLVDLDGENKLNSPNDLVVDRRGRIWFTDPTFGIDEPEEGYGGRSVTGGEYVYRFDPDSSELTRLSTPAVKTPNGLAFAPNETTLYIADSEQGHDREDASLNHHIVAYDVGDDGALSNERIFTEVSPGVPDGLKVDEHGNVWTSSDSGLQVFNPEGQRLGRVDLPERTANLAFAEHDGQHYLFVTATSSLYRIPVSIGEARSERD
ncbi:SMP-30/gluconolactonase/LRE family protein [Kushneria indalinina]|uniref:Gluconolactonase n=1 Tax=Kushneria indalinina DSM 14324 TaxID=1122140 RepID=A0A3D9DW97_9GAMM|nr:SMP-30/gluconolactonase/LRE family protein [Kushneria indalinina]REC94669.1 gluconolactonase [Kushneria indalinina DSM 14324]